MASVRCSELGYWNHFVPILNYDSIEEYAVSIGNYIDEELISSQTELYYPVRLKSSGENSLEELVSGGVNHIELRNVDVNPFAYSGIDIRDLEFMHLLMVFDACREASELTKENQIRAVLNFKNAAHYDIDTTKIMLEDDRVLSVREAALKVLNEMQEFFGDLGVDADVIIDHQKKKLLVKGERYAERVREAFADGFVKKGLEFAGIRDIEKSYIRM